MNKTKLILGFSLLITLMAGLAAGALIGGRRSSRPPRYGLSRDLNLTPQQEEQMRQIWSALRHRPEEDWAKRREWQKERDDAIRKLIPEDRQAEYDEILKNYEAKLAAHAEERKKAFDEAVEKTRQILTESQRKRYDELLRERRERGPRRKGDQDKGGGPYGDFKGPSGSPKAHRPD